MRQKKMEETLYDIEIHRKKDGYLGKLFSDADGIKEFENEHLDLLLRDITLDIQLALEEFQQRQSELSDQIQV
jgi:hypothetical protein